MGGADAAIDRTVASPCVGVCQLDDRSVCLGCGRMIGEIAEWSLASEERRLQIVRIAAQRQADRGPA